LVAELRIIEDMGGKREMSVVIGMSQARDDGGLHW
jgi:hypothetical protein